MLYSSVAAGSGFRNHAVTGTVKAAVEGLTRSLAAELAPKVRVNCIAPTLTRTPLAAAFTGNPLLAEGIARQHPLARLGEPDDLAGVAAMLLGPGRPLHHGRGDPCRRRPQQYRRMSGAGAAGRERPGVIQARRAGVSAAMIAGGRSRTSEFSRCAALRRPRGGHDGRP